MRSCLHGAQPVRKSFQTCFSSSANSKRQSALPLRPRRPFAAPGQQYHQQRNTMNVAAAAMPALNAALAGISIGVLAAWLDARLKSRKPDLQYTPNEFNSAVLDRCPTMQSTYKCTPFLTNGHAETILVAKLRKPPGVVYKREILVTKDGGAVAVDWEHIDDEGKDLPEDAPVLILFPGLTGGSGDSYVQHAVLQARHAGVRAAVFNSRGTADSPVLTPQFYSASFTDDTREVIAHVRDCYPSSTLFAAGWSLGANILVNYLGEQGADTPLEAAVSMCNPFDLTISNRHINEGFNKIYNWNLASSLKKIFLKHQPLWRTYKGPGQPELVPDVKTIREFDEAITVHSFDWADVDAYYAGSSSAKRIPKVAIPLLCIQAADDPIAPEEAIPYEAIKQNPNCTLVVTPCGGHLGWAAGRGAPFSEPWTDAAVVEWLTSVHAQLQEQKAGETAAHRQVRQTNCAADGSRAAADDDDEDGSNGGGGSNGSNGSGSVRELEAAGVGATGRSNSSSELTAAAPLSRQASSSSDGSSAFISPVNSPGSSGSTSRLVTAGSGDTSSVTSSRSRQRGRQQQQGGGVLASGSSEPADLMEQLWWGQGASLAQASSQSACPSRIQQQQQQCAEEAAASAVAAGVVAAVSPVLAAAAAARQQQAQQPVQQVSPFAAASGVVVGSPAAVAPAVAASDAGAAGTSEEPSTYQAQAVSVIAASAAVAESLTAAPATPAVATAVAAPSEPASSVAVERAESELWQSVRWAF